MEFQEFEQAFGELFEDTDVKVFTFDTNFRNLDEWDSLIAMSFIAMADAEYGVKVTGDEIKKADTIGDLYELVKNKI